MLLNGVRKYKKFLGITSEKMKRAALDSILSLIQMNFDKSEKCCDVREALCKLTSISVVALIAVVMVLQIYQITHF